MDSLEEVFLNEAKAVVRELALKLNTGRAFGAFSSSIYDTAWLARVHAPTSENDWVFPECFAYLLQSQEECGGWPVHASDLDGILNTMAALIALKAHQAHPGPGEKDCNPPDLTERIQRAERHLISNLQTWDVLSTVHVGFEVLVPALLETLEEGATKYEFPGRHTLMAMNQQKLGNFEPKLLYSRRKTTLVHSLEAFVGKIDFARVSHHLDRYGSMMASPAATAAYLMHGSVWDASAEAYLREVIMYGSGMGSGCVPGAYPSSNFEVTWTMSTLLKAQIHADIFELPETTAIRNFIQARYESNGGIMGWDSGLLEDSDDTAKALLSLSLLGQAASPERLVEEFEASEHFRTYSHEQNWSFSANCNVLDALLHCSKPAEYLNQIIKIAKFLCRKFMSGQIRDKWNLDDGYSTMLLSQALVKLLQCWESGVIGDLPADLIGEQIPIVLLQMLLRTLQRQSPDGSWKFNTASNETTAYAVLALKALVSIPWHAHLVPRVREAIQHGSAYLVLNHSLWSQPQHIWVAKVTYALPPIAKVYCIAALCASGLYNWQDKAKNLITVSTENMQKMARFFSGLPIFSNDEMWALEADVLLGNLYRPQLLRAKSNIFPQQAIEYKYLEYIPFTWIATNRRNQYPLSQDILWEMMRISVLTYQLDQFMETMFHGGQDVDSIMEIRQLVRDMCQFDDHEFNEQVRQSNNTQLPPGDSNELATKKVCNTMQRVDEGSNGKPRSLALVEVRATLQRFISYILHRPAVVRSPTYVRKQLHHELCTCILAHLDHEEDNARFVAQQQGTRGSGQVSKEPRSSEIITPFTAARMSYFSWIQTTAADDTQEPAIFSFFTCLVAPAPGEALFQGARQRYVAGALSRHLANLCRQYNDYGSVGRDCAEGNVNSVNFVEFHTLLGKDDSLGNKECSSQRQTRKEHALKADLFAVAEFERECLNHAVGKLGRDMEHDPKGNWKMKALGVFIDTVDLYGQIYVARDITNRVR